MKLDYHDTNFANFNALGFNDGAMTSSQQTDSGAPSERVLFCKKSSSLPLPATADLPAARFPLSCHSLCHPRTHRRSLHQALISVVLLAYSETETVVQLLTPGVRGRAAAHS
uniref:Uncharacterized protein n=1 Tax=Cucumis sativus TaxID=3659 RepID=A0A0A0LI41_CUCSA